MTTVKPDAGLPAPDLFAGGAAALGAFSQTFYKKSQFGSAVLTSGWNFFARRNVTAILLDVLKEIIGEGPVQAWATASLHGRVMDVMHSLLTDTPIRDSATPLVERTRPDVPYLGARYNAAEQVDVAPSRPTPHPA